MLGTIEARAVAKIDAEEFPVFVDFDLDRGLCKVDSLDETGGEPFSLRAAVAGGIYLKNVEVTSPCPALSAEELGPFMVASATAGDALPDSGIKDSRVAQCFKLSEMPSKSGAVYLKPLNSRIDLNLSDVSHGYASEVLFYCEPKTKLDCTISVDGYAIRVHSFRANTSLEAYVRCESSQADLSSYLSPLRIGISLFLGKRAFFHLLTNKEGLSINLSKPDRIVSIGMLTQDTRAYQEALERLVAHAKDTQYHFLLEACSNSAPIEVRLLNAFVHMEVILKSRTLDCNEVAKEFGISAGNARALVTLRNLMIHEGVGVGEAIDEAIVRVRSDSKGHLQPSFLEEVKKTESPHGFTYLGLMDLLSLHLARDVGLSPEWVTKKAEIGVE